MCIRDRYTSVGTEDEQGAYEIVSYLQKLGHREILFISDVSHKQLPEAMCDVGRKREEGFLRAMSAAGLGNCRDRILRCGNKREEKEALFRELMQRKGRVTAVSYTHLDVHKRQGGGSGEDAAQRAARAPQLYGGLF